MAKRADLLSVDEAAQMLQVTPAWLDSRIAKGELPAVVVDRTRYVRPTDLDTWIEGQRIHRRPGGRRN